MPIYFLKWFLDTSHRHPLSGRSKLTDAELTHLRKQAYHLPTHFVLGRNRNLQGLAAAILKLWEFLTQAMSRWPPSLSFSLAYCYPYNTLQRQRFPSSRCCRSCNQLRSGDQKLPTSRRNHTC